MREGREGREGSHFITWKDGDGAFGWDVAAEIACDVLAGEVGDWTAMKSVTVNTWTQDLKAHPLSCMRRPYRVGSGVT